MCTNKQPPPPTEDCLSCSAAVGESTTASPACQLRADVLPVPKHQFYPWHGNLVGDSACFPRTGVTVLIITRLRNGRQPVEPTYVRSQRKKYQYANAIVGDSTSNQARR